MIRIAFVVLISFGTGISLHAQQPSANTRIFPGALTQTEPVISVSSANPNLLFASAVTINTTSGFKSEGVYVSTNGGISWRGSDTCTGQLLSNHGGDPSALIHSSGQLLLTHIGLVFPGVYSHYSTDLGSTWSAAYTVSSQQPEDKGMAATDDNPFSPYYGRVYMAWVSLVVPFPLSFARSTNAGISWTSPTVINNPPPARCSGGSIAIAANGSVFVTWAGVVSTAPFTEDFAGFAASTDGGNTWSVTQNAFDMNGINGTLASKSNIRVNGLPQIAVDNSGGARNGWLYIVSNERTLAPAGDDPDIILHRSSDGGLSWSSGIRVNQDPLNNGKIQYFPFMDIDSTGGTNIIYYDDRFTASDSAEVVLARSTNGGDSWTETVISDHRFKPKPIAGGASSYQGDHIALKAVGGKLHALWMDDASGLYQIWQCIVDLQETGVAPVEAPSLFALRQNYPNPFNPSTTIEYTLHQSSHVTIEIFDQNGKQVATLVNSNQHPGEYRVEFNTAKRSLASGVYTYRLQAGKGSIVKQMLLLK